MHKAGDNSTERTRMYTLLADLLASELTARQREVISLYHKYELSQREIARILGISQPVVSRHLQKANRQIHRFTDRLIP